MKERSLRQVWCYGRRQMAAAAAAAAADDLIILRPEGRQVTNHIIALSSYYIWIYNRFQARAFITYGVLFLGYLLLLLILGSSRKKKRTEQAFTTDVVVLSCLRVRPSSYSYFFL